MTYNPNVRTAGGARRRLRHQSEQQPIDEAVRQRMARILVDGDCADGRHRTETDSENGDEVCRFCGVTVE